MECEKCVCQKICDKTQETCNHFWEGYESKNAPNSWSRAQNTEVDDLINSIKVALIKSFPKKPWTCTDFEQNKSYHCATCNSELDIINHLYCPKCGQKIEWNID